MLLSISVHLSYATTQPCDLLLQIEALEDDAQRCCDTRLTLSDDAVQKQIVGEEGLGMRRWITSGPVFECHYTTSVTVTRPVIQLEHLSETPRMKIPSAAIKYLMPSRYCHSEYFLDFVANKFAGLNGGPLIAAMQDWVYSNFTYDNGASHAGTTAIDSFASLTGVCRDYAHVLIALARAAGIPARFVSAYAPDVTPQDFHAVVEVYLEDAWHIVDPTGMSKACDTARIAIGRDAADASFLTSYGWVNLQEQSVNVSRIVETSP